MRPSKPESGLQNNLKATRTRLEISQQQLAESAGIARQTVGGIEAGQYAPSAGVALRLARALGCRVEDLFWLEDDLPTIEAAAARRPQSNKPAPVALARIGGRWFAHPLEGERAFRMEMIPADGTAEWNPESEYLSVKLLDEPENLERTVILAGCTPALSLWARSAERWHPGLRVHWIHANSMEALSSLARGEVHAAGIHLFDPESGECNVPFVRRALRNEAVRLVNLGTWQEGFAVQSGNPKELTGPADLAQPGVTIVNREQGAGSRVLLDTLLQGNGIASSTVAGYDDQVASHQDVARKVSAKEADVGLTNAAVAAMYGLSFVPLRSIRYDLAVREEYMSQDSVRQLLETLHHRWIRSQLKHLCGFDTTQTGDTIALFSSSGIL